MSVVIRSGDSSNEASVTSAGELKVALAGGGVLTADTELPAATVLADAAANPTAPAVAGYVFVWNGTTWDRRRSASAAAGTPGPGIAAAGILGFDGVNYQRVKTDSAGVVSVSAAITGTPAVTISGTATVAGAVSADTELPAAATLADATANPTAPAVAGHILVWNGATWDRRRSATSGAGTTGVGVPAAGILGFDGANYQRVKTDAAGVVQTAVTGTPAVTISGTATVSVSGTAAVSGSVTADTELPAAATLADAAANATAPTVGAATLVFNGATWDRARSATAVAGSAGIGLPAAGVLGTDGTNYRVLKTDATGVVQVAVTNPTGALPTTAGSGRVSVTTAGTRVQLASQACTSVTVKARVGNSGTVYVGGSTVSAANGFELSPGESMSMDITNTNAIWLDAAISADGVTYVWVG